MWIEEMQLLLVSPGKHYSYIVYEYFILVFFFHTWWQAVDEIQVWFTALYQILDMKAS